jgi:hypothetical protein
MIGLPLAGYVFLFLAFYVQAQGWRAAAIGAATIWGIIVVLITELLSIPRELTRSGLAVAWLVADVAALVYLWLVAHQTLQRRSLKERSAADRQMTPGPMVASTLLLTGVAIIVVLVALTALLSPPNTWDVIAYHMPRVVHWMQHRTVAFYPTSYLPELHSPPWAEFAILHVHLLVDGDRLNNLVQWWGFAGSVVGVTLLAQLLGASSGGQVLAAVFCATIPQGILEASGAKNSYVLAFWSVAVTYYLLAFKRLPTLAHALGVGGALGLAWQTKATAYVFSGPLLLMLALAWPWKTKGQLLRYAPVIVGLVMALNVGHFVRNYTLHGSPLGPKAELPPAFKYTNDTITPTTVASNVLRNLALHVRTPSPAVNQTVENWVVNVIRAIGDDPNNPHTTWTGTPFQISELARHEALAGNLLHLVLILLTLGMIVAWGRLRSSTELLMYVGALVLAFALFCALGRWQPWHTRLHLPLFVLWSVPVGLSLTRAWSDTVTITLAMLLLLASLPFLLGNQLRPLIGGGEFNLLRQERAMLYFSESNHLRESYHTVANFIKGQECRDIGLDLPPDSAEYPLLALLEAHRGLRRVEHVDVGNPSSKYAERESDFRPCAIICLFCSMLTEKWKTHSSSMGQATVLQHHVVFHSKGDPRHEDAMLGQPSPCSLTFLNGWYAGERNGRGWYRWSDGYGEMRVSTSRDIDIVMSGVLYSIQRPNRVDLLVNGHAIAARKVVGDGPFTPVQFHLNPGEHSIVFASRNPAILVPPDTRPLALGLGDLRMISADGTTLCAATPDAGGKSP